MSSPTWSTGEPISPDLANALKAATEEARARHQPVVRTALVLLKALDAPAGDLHWILQQIRQAPALWRMHLTKAAGGTGNAPGRQPQRDDETRELILERGPGLANRIGVPPVTTPGILLLAFLSHEKRSRIEGLEPVFRTIDMEALLGAYANRYRRLSPGIETPGVDVGGYAGERGEDEPGRAVAGRTYLAQFAVNLTAEARAGNLDPVLGRDDEIRQTLDILSRRRKNNPLLVGEAGVGKTAVVEGLALRLAADDVPAHFQGADLWALDLGMLEAGAGVKGEYQRRLRGVIDEVRRSTTPTLLFIDEAHTLIGAGGAEGKSDAANLLKPALARGELRAIAATTWDEYKKFFEKDPALTRRFLPVHVQAPAEEQAVTMLRGVRERFEKSQGVQILDSALRAAVRLANRYLTERNLPDSAVDLIDTACARVRNSITARPPAIDAVVREIGDVELAIASCRRDEFEGQPEAAEKLQAALARKAELEARRAELDAQWSEERVLIEKLTVLRRDMTVLQQPIASIADAPAAPEGAEDIGALRTGILATLTQLKKLQKNTPLLLPRVDPDLIAEIVSDWTGVPAGELQGQQIEEVIDVDRSLGARIFGQDYAVKAIAQQIVPYRAQLHNPDGPIGVFLCLGPSGVGKTECGYALAELVFGGTKYLTKINMSEYSEPHTVSGLVGAPAGYVGYGEGGLLTEAVRRNPFSLVLLDEVDRADPAVWNLFYSTFERGEMKDREGRLINFRNTLFMMTSNLGTEEILEWWQRPEAERRVDDLLEALHETAKTRFPTALLARMKIVPFVPLARPTIATIVRVRLERLGSRLRLRRGAAFSFDEDVVDQITDLNYSLDAGARSVGQYVETVLLPTLSRLILIRERDGSKVRSVTLRSGDQAGQWEWELT